MPDIDPSEEIDAPIRPRLYLITPPRLNVDEFASQLELALNAGDIAAVQLRLKDCDDSTIIEAAKRLMPLVQDRDIAFILNDRPELAADLGCDGVHIGQDDVSYDEARKAVGPDMTVGVSALDSRHLALDAAEAGADYVAFGPVFPTSSKDTGSVIAPLKLFEWWSTMMEVPVVAIGGLTPANCGPVVGAGADFIAVISAIWDHANGTAAAVKAFDAAIDTAFEKRLEKLAASQ